MAPRSEITVRELSGPRAELTADPSTHYDAADAANEHEFVHPGGIVLLGIFNRSGSTMNVTITAVASNETKQMAEDWPDAIPDGDDGWYRIKHDDGYVNSDGKVEIDIDQDATSYLVVFKIS